MEEAVTITDSSQLIMVFTLGAMAVMMVVEMLAPRRKPSAPLGYRWLNNLSLSVVTDILETLAASFMLLAVAWWTDLNDFGLLQHFHIGFAGSFIIVLLVAQFISYWTHRIFHIVPVLWRIHAVHHNDTDVDVTTSYRHHPLEAILTMPFLIPVFLLLGAPVNVTLGYQLVLITISLFSHSNIYLPERLDHVLRKFVITPDFHRNHHCSQQHFTDSNYGNLVPWFDHLFKTATDRPFVEQEVAQLGLEYLREPRDSRLDQLLWLPFKHWRHLQTPKKN